MIVIVKVVSKKWSYVGVLGWVQWKEIYDPQLRKKMSPLGLGGNLSGKLTQEYLPREAA